MSNQLLPCPFCGAEPAPFWNGVGCVTAKCAMDGLHISIEAWNRRATQPTAGEPVHQVEFRGLDGGGWHDVDRETMELRKAEPKHWHARTLWTAPPAAAAPVAAGEPVATLRLMRSLGGPSVKVLRFDADQLPHGTLVDVYAAPPAAAHGDEAATLVKALSLLWKTTNFLPRGGSLDGRVSAFLAQYAPEPMASAAAMRPQGDGEVQ